MLDLEGVELKYLILTSIIGIVIQMWDGGAFRLESLKEIKNHSYRKRVKQIKLLHDISVDNLADTHQELISILENYVSVKDIKYAMSYIDKSKQIADSLSPYVLATLDYVAKSTPDEIVAHIKNNSEQLCRELKLSVDSYKEIERNLISSSNTIENLQIKDMRFRMVCSIYSAILGTVLSLMGIYALYNSHLVSTWLLTIIVILMGLSIITSDRRSLWFKYYLSVRARSTTTRLYELHLTFDDNEIVEYFNNELSEDNMKLMNSLYLLVEEYRNYEKSNENIEFWRYENYWLNSALWSKKMDKFIMYPENIQKGFHKLFITLYSNLPEKNELTTEIVTELLETLTQHKLTFKQCD